MSVPTKPHPCAFVTPNGTVCSVTVTDAYMLCEEHRICRGQKPVGNVTFRCRALVPAHNESGICRECKRAAAPPRRRGPQVVISPRASQEYVSGAFATVRRRI